MAWLFYTTLIVYSISLIGYFVYLFKQNNQIFKWSFFLLILGFLFHTATVIYSYVITGYIPANDLKGTLLIAGWIITGTFLAFQHKFQFKILGIYTAFLSTLIILIASQLQDVPAESKNIFNSFWLVSHIITIFIGYAAFALAGGAGLFYLFQEKALKQKTKGFFFKRLPSLELIDNSGYAFITVGFTTMTIGLITGMVYAHLIWGKFWSWDPKEVWSGITWLLYAALLHGRVSGGWRGKKAAIMAIVGFVVLLFTFFGVNLFLKGHHGEFTKF